MMRLRKIWAEGSFSVLKREHCISKIRKRGISAATEECLLAVMALNLKRMVKAIFFMLNIQFIWAEAVFPMSSFPFCQQVPYCTLSQNSHTILFLKNLELYILSIKRAKQGRFSINKFEKRPCFNMVRVELWDLKKQRNINGLQSVSKGVY